MGKAEFEKALHTLKGLLLGIHADRKLNINEIEELQHWCMLQNDHKNMHPFKEIIPLVIQSIEDGILSTDEINDVLWVVNSYSKENNYYDLITHDIQILHGILHGILSDNKINEKELVSLRNWLIDNDHLESTYPYDEVYSMISNVLEDGIIDEKEHKFLKAFFTDFIDTTASLNIHDVDIEEMKKEMRISGICAIDPNIELRDSVFCFTGESSKMKRNEIKNVIEDKGGIFKNNIVNNLNYLIVGDNNNPCWTFSCYGRKIEKAIGLRKKGKQIVIAHEVDFWDALVE
ncbi:NAD-dependent DNA ligase [Chengkuizengella sp. YPA3-1-1]|uniref:NAD-dependent DNA ligase n=2 Tax=Chengkuizengella marina TaxID=2507566 RepID=A0A6N9Q1F0_9BACL|nr:NAD-dependent DNA ligase [Chengkuizengella marina]